MARIRADFMSGVLSSSGSGTGGSYTTTDTTFTSPGFTSLPVVASPDILVLVIDPVNVTGNREKVTVTAHASGANTVTVVRGSDGPTTGLPTYPHNNVTNSSGGIIAESWGLCTTSGDFAELETETANNLSNLQGQINTSNTNITTNANNISTLQSAPGPSQNDNPSGKIYNLSGSVTNAWVAAAMNNSVWLYAGMTNSSGGLVVPVTGVYAVAGQVQTAYECIWVQAGVMSSGNMQIVGSRGLATGTSDAAAAVAGHVRCSAGDLLQLAIKQGATTATALSYFDGDQHDNWFTAALVAHG